MNRVFETRTSPFSSFFSKSWMEVETHGFPVVKTMGFQWLVTVS